MNLAQLMMIIVWIIDMKLADSNVSNTEDDTNRINKRDITEKVQEGDHESYTI